MRVVLRSAPGLLGALFLLLGGGASAVTIGVPAGTGNCFPFGCVGLAPSSRYQQVYSAAAFSGPLLIQEIRFFQTLFPGGALNDGTFTITLSTSANPVNGLDTDFDANLGIDAQLFSVSILPGTSGGVLSFVPTLGQGGAAFLYDPSQGDLLLDVQIAGLSQSGNAFFDSREGDAPGLFSVAHNFGQAPATFADSGLVTAFVPEPGTGLLLGFGLAVLARTRRRQDPATRRQP